MVSRLSEHPVDVLIRRLIDSASQASAEDVEAILDRMASVSFSNRLQRVPVRLRVRYQGRQLGQRADALYLHLVKRVVEDQQWSSTTTAAGYLHDIRTAIRAERTRLVVFRTWGGAFAATVTPTEDAVPVHRRGARWEPLLFGLYSADDAIIVTAYMISSLASLRLPGDARWLN